MKRSDFFFTLALPPLDFLMLLAAGIIPYFLRALPSIKNSGLVSPIFYAVPLYTYFLIIAGIACVWILIFSINGLYNISYPRKFFDQILKIIVSCSTGIALVIIALFLKREFLLSSRFLIISSWILSIFLLVIARSLIRVIRQKLFQKSLGLQNAIIIGSDENTKAVANFLRADLTCGYNVVDVLSHTKNLENKFRLLSKNTKIHEIIIADLHSPREERLAILNFCNANQLVFRYAADMFATHVRNIDIDTVGGIPLVEIRRTPLYGWGGVIKSIFDFWLALILAIILMPFFMILAIAIKLNSRGPILVKLPRIGRGGKIFEMYKFRSMVAGAREKKKNLLRYNERKDGPLFKMTNDPRITSIGKFIRHWSIDEFGQLINVLKGEMSLVGPRAHEPEEVAQYRIHHKKLLYIRPGIVCLAAISGRSGLTFEEEAHLDTYYVENWSFALDINILLKTPLVVISRKNAV